MSSVSEPMFSVQQSVNRAFHSTETAILAVHNDLVRAVDNNRVSLLVSLDLSAAVDTVDHNIPLSSVSAIQCHRNSFLVVSVLSQW